IGVESVLPRTVAGRAGSPFRYRVILYETRLTMCYSAMVQQDAKRLARQFDAEIQLKMFAELFERRANGEKILLNKAMELPFLKSSKSMDEKAIAKTIRQWHEAEIPRLEAEIE